MIIPTQEDVSDQESITLRTSVGQIFCSTAFCAFK